MRPSDNVDWFYLESNSHRPEIQDVIATAIRAGTIRVVPAPNGRIRIIPAAPKTMPTSDAAVARPEQERKVIPAIRLTRMTRPAIRRWPGTAVSS